MQTWDVGETAHQTALFNTHTHTHTQYFLTLTVSIYSSITCLVVLVLITLFDRGGPTKHLSSKQANSMNVILLLEIFIKTNTDIYKYWNYLLMFSFVHNYLYIVTSVFCIVMGCACQLVITRWHGSARVF